MEEQVQTADVSQVFHGVSKKEMEGEAARLVVDAKVVAQQCETIASVGEEITVVEESVSTIQLEEVREFIEETITTEVEKKGNLWNITITS